MAGPPPPAPAPAGPCSWPTGRRRDRRLMPPACRSCAAPAADATTGWMQQLRGLALKWLREQSKEQVREQSKDQCTNKQNKQTKQRNKETKKQTNNQTNRQLNKQCRRASLRNQRSLRNECRETKQPGGQQNYAPPAPRTMGWPFRVSSDFLLASKAEAARLTAKPCPDQNLDDVVLLQCNIVITKRLRGVEVCCFGRFARDVVQKRASTGNSSPRRLSRPCCVKITSQYGTFA